VKLSRHARNNMRLYGIKETEIQETINSPDREDTQEGRKVAYKTFPNRFSGLPLKVIFVIGKETVIITAYPLKKSYLSR
jgi:hypothetical protein